MKQRRILLVTHDNRRAKALKAAIAGAVMLQAVHRADGESAVLWAGANACDLCVISYELPGIDGIETLVRIRNRRPDVPMIMFSDTTDQDVAIAAFRAGVVDFIPTRGTYAQTIAEQAQSLLGLGQTETSSPRPAAIHAVDDPTLAHIPPERLAPTYQNRLRAIGRQLDLHGLQTMTIVEVEGGFLIRAEEQHEGSSQTLEFLDRDFPRLVASAIHERIQKDGKPVHHNKLTPTGYEDALRAVGSVLDRESAEAIVITELSEMLVVAGRGPDEKRAGASITPFNHLLKRANIEHLLDDAVRRRGTIQPKITRPGPKPVSNNCLRNVFRRLN